MLSCKFLLSSRDFLDIHNIADSLADARGSGTEILAFLVLDIGLPVLDDLNSVQKFASSFLQSASVRATGFGFVSISSLSPAVLILLRHPNVRRHLPHRTLCALDQRL